MKARPTIAWATLAAFLSHLMGGCGAGHEWAPPAEVTSERKPLVVPVAYQLHPTEAITVGLGDTPRTLSVSSDGEAQVEVPLWVPPGRAGVQPQLALGYGSRRGNGLLGVGWSLRGLSQITRCKRTSAQDGEPAPVSFLAVSRTFCLDGKRLVPVGTLSGNEEFRPEGEPGTRVILVKDVAGQADYFKVFTSDGRLRSYGLSSGLGAGSNSRLEGERVRFDIASPVGGFVTDAVTRTTTINERLSWALTAVQDRSGNYLTVKYQIHSATAPSGEVHVEQLPIEIAYTGLDVPTPWHHKGATFSPTRKVAFAYSDRPDKSFTYVAGFKQASTKLLTSITMSGPSLADRSYAGASHVSALRVYSLSYKSPTITKRSLLGAIEECDGQPTPTSARGVCRHPVSFDWELGCGVWAPGGAKGSGCAESEFEDVDTNVDITRFKDDAVAMAVTPEFADHWTLQVADINGDGLDDILYRIPTVHWARWCKGEEGTDGHCYDSVYGFEIGWTTGYKMDRQNWYYRLSMGRGFGPAVLAGLPKSVTGGRIDDLRIVDLDGDGAAEILVAKDAVPNTGDDGSYDAYRFDGAKFQSIGLTGETFIGWWNASEKYQFPRMQAADLDGDGRPELIRSAVLLDPYNPSPNPVPHQWGFKKNTAAGSSGPTIVFPSNYTPLEAKSGIDHEAYSVAVDNDGAVKFLTRVAQGQFAQDGFSPQLYSFGLRWNGSVRQEGTALSALPFELSTQLQVAMGLSPPVGGYPAPFNYLPPQQNLWVSSLCGSGRSPSV
ncbi:MAG: FG-GAP repeat domain-containing protein [Myxococcaceae bacterium]